MTKNRYQTRQLWKVWHRQGEYFPTKPMADARVNEINSGGGHVPPPGRVAVPIKAPELALWLTARMREIEA